MNIENLRNKDKFDSLLELTKVSEFLQTYYYEKELPEHWIDENILNNMDLNLYVYFILTENRNILLRGDYLEIIRKLKDISDKPSGKLYLVAYKFQDKQPNEPIKTDTKRIGKLESDISEIKELLKNLNK